MFTSTLSEVLEATGNNIAYADLFVRCRAAVRKRADNQNPQFETYRGFQAYSGFLGGQAAKKARRFSVYFDKDSWRVGCGALHGLPSDVDKQVEFALYSESEPAKLAGHAASTQVGAQKSELKLLDLNADESTRYQAEITSLPVPPMFVYLDGEPKGTEAFQEFYSNSKDGSLEFSLITDTPQAARYTLVAAEDRFLLKLRESGKLLQGANGYTEPAAEYMFSILKQVADWERAAALQNHATKMNLDDVPFKCSEVLNDNEKHEYPANDITINIDKTDGEWKIVQGTLKANNLTQQPLHMLLVHFADDYGFQVLFNERVEPINSEFVVTLDGNETFNLSLEDAEGRQ